MSMLSRISALHSRHRPGTGWHNVLLALPGLVAMVSCGGDGGPGTSGNERLATLQLDATHPVQFSYLSGVRELSDGTILAADPASQVLLRINMDAGTADTLGREGAGPNEYRGPDRVFPLPGDSTLLIDLGNGRFTVIDPEGTFVNSSPMTTSTDDGMGHTVHPSFVDGMGNMYAGGLNYREDPPDSTAVHKIERVTGEETRVASVWHSPYERMEPGAKRPMLRPYDDWAVGEDGRVAVVRANGYSVDWYFHDGQVVNGPPNEVKTYPCGSPEHEAELNNFISNATYAMTEFSEEGVQSLIMARGIPASSAPGVDDLAWPETLPVFHVSATLVSPDGEVWVHRMMPAGGPGRVEVFDDRAARIGFIELPPGSKVIGFGGRAEAERTAYVTRTDDVGLIWLERHRIIRAADRR